MEKLKKSTFLQFTCLTTFNCKMELTQNYFSREKILTTLPKYSIKSDDIITPTLPSVSAKI